MTEKEDLKDRSVLKGYAKTILSSWPHSGTDEEKSWYDEICKFFDDVDGGMFSADSRDKVVETFENNVLCAMPFQDFPHGFMEPEEFAKYMPSEYFDKHGIGKPSPIDLVTFIQFSSKVLQKGISLVTNPRTGESEEQMEDLADKINRAYYRRIVDRIADLLKNYPREEVVNEG